MTVTDTRAMNTLTIQQLADICNKAINEGHGDKPVHISVDWAICPATAHTSVEHDEYSTDFCLIIRDDMRDQAALEETEDERINSIIERLILKYKDRSGFRELPVKNFLYSCSGSSKSDAMANLAMDARSCKWTYSIYNAIQDGIQEIIK